MLTFTQFGGIAPKITPELLPAHLAQTAQNVVLHNGGVRSLAAPVDVATPTKAGTKKTIYRFGRNQPEGQYWLTWTTPVHVVKGPIAGDTTERTYYTGDGVPKKTDMTLALQSGTDYPMAFYNLGVPAPTSAPVLDVVAGTGPEVEETRAYVYTNVTAWGEESGPSPADLIGVTSALVAKLTLSAPLPTGAYNISARRIYRSVTSSAGTQYYFVGEVPAATAEFTDAVDTTAIGEPLATLDWDMPPDDLAGLIALPSGALCAYSGKQVCFSVIGAPYAWPAKYRLTCDYNVVAVFPMGQGVVVLTDGYPYLINTGDPEAAQMLRLDEEQACVSARSVAPYGGGVLYASPDGMVLVTASGCNVVTKDLFDRAAWQALGPANLFGAKHDNRYYGFLANGGFVLDASGNFSTHTLTATAAYVDPVLDQLYIAVGTKIQKWDAGSALAHAWKSKRFNLSAPFQYAWVQIKANSFSSLTFKLFIDGALKHTQVVTSRDPFRLPGGFRAHLYECEISGTSHWTAFALASSVEELKNGF